jgi:hypothetical protein
MMQRGLASAGIWQACALLSIGGSGLSGSARHQRPLTSTSTRGDAGTPG